MSSDLEAVRAWRRRGDGGGANRLAHVANRAGDFDPMVLGELIGGRVDDSTVDATRPAGAGPAPLDFAVGNVRRWVPIGPSVVRQGQAEGRPPVSGRVSDLQVSANGQRIYASSAKGGLWYSGDAGSTWDPVGNWANAVRGAGGNLSGLAIGSILVAFHPGNDKARDHVMVGTGELTPSAAHHGAQRVGGVGVLAALGPASWTLGNSAWPAPTGLATMAGGMANPAAGLGILRLVRKPGSTAGSAAAARDFVVAVTSNGLAIGAGTTTGYTWTQIATPALVGGARPTDAVWIPLGTNGRLFVAFDGFGLVYSDNIADPTALGFAPTFTAVPGASGAAIVGRCSLTTNDNQSAVYGLGARNVPPVQAEVWTISNPSAAAPSVPSTPVASAGTDPNMTHAALWRTGQWYAHGLAATGTGTDQVYVGGLTLQLAVNRQWQASLWAFNVNAATGALTAIPGVSDTAGAGADQAGLIGNNVHADVHAIRVAANPVAGNRSVWVGCDGGVFRSTLSGATHSFVPRNTGLATVEAGYVASHPISRHYVMLGAQDNGTQMRVGETVWETTLVGDGGGVAFHPIRPDFVIGQMRNQFWRVRPQNAAAAPFLSDPAGAGSSFYSGADAIRTAPAAGRVAMGSNRVLVSDAGTITSNPASWRVLPFTLAVGPAQASIALNVAGAAFGISAVALGPVHTVKWATGTTLLALYTNGVVRYDQNGAGNWTTTVVQRIPAGAIPTDIAPVPVAAPPPGTNPSFYLTTATQATIATIGPTTPVVDTCFFFDGATGILHATGLDNQLQNPAVPGSNELDPAASVIVDIAPGANTAVYVGTATGAWQGTRTAPNTHAWATLINGTPDALVQDLTIWANPADPTAPRLLRAALQSRGIWELDLTQNEVPRTYVRVHPRDGRRQFPTPLANPRRRPTAPPVPALASPDIVVRPQTPVATAPRFRGANPARPGDFLTYQLWTFQTALRWRYPSVVANGVWSDALADMVVRERLRLGFSANPVVDAQLWNAVVGAQQDEAGNLAVYRAPWQDATSPTNAASEIDIMDSVVPRRDSRGVWQVYREPSTIEVLLHHRDTRPLDPTAAPAQSAYCVLLWQSGAAATLRRLDPSAFPAYARSLVSGGAAVPTPPGWNVIDFAPGNPLHRLGVPLSARLPRAASINLDLSTVQNGRSVMLMALAGSDVDQFSHVPAGAVDTPENLVRNWAHAAGRMIRVFNRP